MPVTAWTPGTLYIPGSLVTPASSAPSSSTGITNPGFESGATGWQTTLNWAITSNDPFSGSNSAEFDGTSGESLINDDRITVSPGTSITMSCMVKRGTNASATAQAILTWYDSGASVISTDAAPAATFGGTDVWQRSTVTGVAPPLAATCSIGVTASSDGSSVFADDFQWNYLTESTVNTLIFKAIQTAAGFSGSVEPTWPTSPAGTVVDNEVTWEAEASGSVTWETSSVLTSGSSEPTWPEEAGAFVSDNNIAWETVPLRITDEDCPHTKVVAIAASKVFAGDGDIVRFCATLNARDWSTQADAGFLPTGLQQKSQVGVTAMGVYRGNLAVWSPSTFQIWQVDPDPASMALLDAMEGIGSTHQQAVQPVSDDLFFLSALGVRTVSISEGANNLSTGDAGVPIDILVQAETVPTVEPHATYYPGAGQYWLAFRTLSMPVLAVGAYLLTSTLYPIEAVESYAGSGDYEKGTLAGYALSESLDSGGSYAGGELSEIIVETSTQTEYLDSSGTYESGSLLDVVHNTDVVESLDSSGLYVDGELANKLVTNATGESLDCSGTYVSGILTS